MQKHSSTLDPGTEHQPLSLSADILAAIRLSIPMAGAQLAQIALQVTDNVVCGRLGSTSLAGVGLGVAAYAMLLYPLLGVINAVCPLVAQAHGAGDTAGARRSLHQALLLAVVLGLFGWGVLSQGAGFLRWMGQPPELVALADTYLQVMRWGVMPALLATALRGFLDSLGLPRFGLLVALSAIAVNLLGNWLLVFGNWGFPALGITGSGWATVTVNLWSVLCLGAFIFRQPVLRSFHVFSHFELHLPGLREQLRIGVPAAFAMMAEVWLFTGLSFLMGKLGTTAVAAHQIALNAASTAFMIALGISNASTVRVGQAIGRGESRAALRAGLIGMGLGMVCMSMTGLLFWLTPRLVIGVYLDLQAPGNAAVVALATALLQLAALFQLFDALQVTSQGALRGLKDTFGPMLLGFASYWGVGLGSGLYLGFGLKLGAQGLWIGLILGLMAAGLALSARFVLKARVLSSLQSSSD